MATAELRIGGVRKWRCLSAYSASITRLKRLLSLIALREPAVPLNTQHDLRRLRNRADEVRIAIAEQMDNIPLYDLVPFIEHRKKVEPRIVAIARTYLEQVEYNPTADSWKEYLLCAADRSLRPLYAWENRLFESALQLHLLLRIHDWLCSVLAGDCCSHYRPEELLRNINVTRGLRASDIAASVAEYESVLDQDPAEIYPKLDPATKWMYREAVDRIARVTHCTSTAVALACLNLTRLRERELTHKDLASHVGYYLIDNGSSELITLLSSTSSGPHVETMKPPSVAVYVRCLALTTIIAAAGCAYYFRCHSWLLFTALVSLILSDGMNRVLDAYYFFTTPPRRLPRLDYSSSIPTHDSVVVCVPSVLIGDAGVSVRKLLSTVERHRLDTPGNHVVFCLLTDFGDSDEQSTLATENQILYDLESGVRVLNNKYGSCFLLLHRDRRFSPTERRWIGWERKRGKLLMLNRLIADGTNEFSLSVGNVTALRECSSVIVLDDNMRLPEGGVNDLVGTLAHPLNRPLVRNDKVIHGFGIIQPFPCTLVQSTDGIGWLSPLLAPTCRGYHRGPFVRSLHFDLFGMCSFHGKGIYDVKAVHAVIGDRIPEEQVLSHDTVEGGMIRTGFVGDITTIETAPNDLKQYYERLHRWVRGDWQNLAMLLANYSAFALTPLTYYMLFHYCRRSLFICVRPVVLAAIALARPAIAARLAILYLSITMTPDCIYAIGYIIKSIKAGQIVLRLPSSVKCIMSALQREICLAAVAIHLMFVIGDALIRVAYRRFTRRNLLEWRMRDDGSPKQSGSKAIDLYAYMSLLISLLIIATCVETETSFWSCSGVIVPLLWIAAGWQYLRTS